jgi:hypothetical protein
MPRGIHLSIPIPSRISPDSSRAAQRHVEWLASFGLFPTESSRQRHSKANFAELGARLHPTAVDGELDLAVDEVGWFFRFDDCFDGLCGEPSSAPELVRAVVAALERPMPANLPPIARAFADLWRRAGEGMSNAWHTRTADHWRECFFAHIEEQAARRSRRPLALDEYFVIRRATIGVEPVLDFAERVARLEVPADVVTSSHLIEMRRLMSDIILLHNDVCSIEKEEAAGDGTNVLLILERERSCSRSEAQESACAMIRERIRQYLAFERELPQAVSEAVWERAALERYRDDVLRPMIRGAYDWTEGTGRYEQVEVSADPKPSSKRIKALANAIQPLQSDPQ